MSASKFCRNFLSFPPLGVTENSCHITGERQHQYDYDMKMRKTPAAQLNAKDQDDCSVSLVAVYIPEIRQDHHDDNVPPARKLSNIYHNKSSAWFRHVQFIVSSKLPSGSTLVSDRGVFCTKNAERPFACAFCGKAFKSKKNVFQHITHNHTEKRYSCEFCGKRSAQPSDLTKHMRIHTQEKPFKCNQCGKQFRFDSSLRTHKIHKHSKERPFHCNQCNKSFKTRGALSSHMKSHNKDEQGECDICKKKYTHLKDHMLTHTAEKPFKCTLCEKQFHLKILLSTHMHSHSGKKRNPKKSCSICGKTCWESYMPTHMRMHAGVKPYECNTCGKRFPKKTNLDGHIRSHTGEKPFACDRCDKRFALYSNMVTHKAKCTKRSSTR